MDETATLWIFGMVITVQIAVIGAIASALWIHIGHCKDTAASLARIETDVSRMREDIGTHERGMRGDLHRHGNDILKINGRLDMLEER